MNESSAYPYRTPLGARLPHAVERFFPESQVRRYKRGAIVVRGAVDGLYILESGRVRITAADADGRQAVLAVLAPRNVVSELEFGRDTTYGLGITALEPCEMTHVASRELHARLRGNPTLVLMLSDCLAARVRNAYARIARLACRDVRDRVARLLLECAILRDGMWTVEEGSEEIARSVAASREMVSRVMKQFAGAGLVRRQRRGTLLLDRDGLRSRF